MLRVAYFAVIFCLISTTVWAAKEKKDETPNSKLSVGDIEDYIDQERPLLRGKFKVSLSRKFLAQSPAKKQRYGNTVTILNLKGLSFSGMDLKNVEFNLANMSDTNLKGADLTGSDLISVDFTGANLHKANFTNADLSNAHFEDADLEDTNFTGANLFNATFNKIKGLDDKQLEELKNKTSSYQNLDRQALPDYYNEEKK